MEIEGKSFTVVKVLPETGTVDDDRVFANLHTVQALLGTGEQISAIEIMGCCSEISDGLLGKLRNVLPDTRITTIGQIVSTQIGNQQNDEQNIVGFSDHHSFCWQHLHWQLHLGQCE
ncbi:MAG: hypothetical protein MZV64_20725 [Ignavibacteriales bacterium]|nr:hypothetical protein [Ignavibacteriales bacterium]